MRTSPSGLFPVAVGKAARPGEHRLWRGSRWTRRDAKSHEQRTLMNLKKRQTQRGRKQTCGYQGGKGAGEE